MQPAIPFTVADLLPPGARRAASLLDGCLGLATLQRLDQSATAHASQDFPERALATLGIKVDIAPGDLEPIPATGPVVVVANHPHGAADGLAVLHTLRRVRPDVKLLGNECQGEIEMSPFLAK